MVSAYFYRMKERQGYTGWIFKLKLTITFLSFLSLYCSHSFGQKASVTAQAGKEKLSPLLLDHLSTLRDDDLVPIEILLLDTSDISRLFHDIQIPTISSTKNTANLFLLETTTSKKNITELIAYPSVLFIELVRKPFEELKQEGLDLSINEVKLVHHQFPEWSGTNMTVSIKEDLFDTTDIDFKNRIHHSPIASDKIRLHAANMASIAAG